jgi:hypothetical protein
VPFAHAKVGYRHAIFKRKSPASKEDRAFLFADRHEVPGPVAAAAPVRAHPHPVVAAACAGAAAPVSPEACESPRLLTCCGAWRE